MKYSKRWALSFFVVLAPLLAEQPALAQTKASKEAEARQLAEEAWQLLEAHRSTEACALYRKALSLTSSPGLLNSVGRCFVQEGDPVRAMETFESAVELAKQHEAGPKRQAWLDFARHEIDALEPQLSKLVLRLPRIAGLTLRLDGESLPVDRESVWVEPGVHHLDVSAPSRTAHTAELTLSAGQRLQVEVPTLELAAATSSPVPVPAVTRDDSPLLPTSSSHEAEPSRVLPWTLVGTGSAVIVAGAVTGLMALSKRAELEEGCRDNYQCPSENEDPGWQGKINSTETLATVTDVLWGVGLVTLGVGVTLLVLDDGDVDAPSQIEASCRGGGCGLRWSGSF